jgi:hypothetical protein
MPTPVHKPDEAQSLVVQWLGRCGWVKCSVAQYVPRRLAVVAHYSGAIEPARSPSPSIPEHCWILERCERSDAASTTLGKFRLSPAADELPIPHGTAAATRVIREGRMARSGASCVRCEANDVYPKCGRGESPSECCDQR